MEQENRKESEEEGMNRKWTRMDANGEGISISNIQRPRSNIQGSTGREWAQGGRVRWCI